MKAAREIVLSIGVALVLAGIGTFDWRCAVIATGVVAAGGSLWGMLRQ